jgi:hypothetical protein
MVDPSNLQNSVQDTIVDMKQDTIVDMKQDKIVDMKQDTLVDVQQTIIDYLQAYDELETHIVVLYFFTGCLVLLGVYDYGIDWGLWYRSPT